MHSGSEQWPVPDWVLPQDCWAILLSECIHHGVSLGSVPTFSGFQFRIPLSGLVSPTFPPASKKSPPSPASTFQLLHFPNFVSSLRLNPNRSLPPLQLCPWSTSSHTKTSGPRELPRGITSFPSLPELSPQPHSQLAHQELLSPIQYQSKCLLPLLLHPARTQPEANRRTAQICIFTFYSLQLLGCDSEQTS